jgi:hypothetical protein
MRSERIGFEEDDTDLGTAKAASRPSHIPFEPRRYVSPICDGAWILESQEGKLDQQERKAGHSAEYWNAKNSIGRIK